MQNKKLHIYEFITKTKSLTYIFLIPIILSFVLCYTPIVYIIFIYLICILIFFSILYFQFYSYINKNISFYGKKIKIRSGVFTQKTISFDINRVCSIFFEQTIITRILGAYKTFFIFNKQDRLIKKGIYLTTAQINFLKERFIENGVTKTLYKIKLHELIALTFFNNGAVYSIILAISFLRNLQKKLGVNLLPSSRHIIENLQNPLEVFYILSSAAYTILFGSLLVLILQIMKLWGLSVGKSQDKVLIKRGIIFSYFNVIPKTCIHAISFKKNLLNIILNKKIMYIHFAKGKTHNNLAAAVVENNCLDVFNFLDLKQLNYEIFKVSPQKKSIFSHLYFPFFIEFLLILIFIFLPNNIKFLLIFLSIIIFIWLLFIRIYSFKRSYLKLTPEAVSLATYKGFYLYESIIPIKYIKIVKITQSPFQILSKRCNIQIYSFCNIKENFKIKHLNVNNVENFVEILENLHINY